MAIQMIDLKAASKLVCMKCRRPPFAVLSCLDTMTKELIVTVTCHKVEHSISLGTTWANTLTVNLSEQIQQTWDQAIMQWEKSISTFARPAAKPKVETKEVDYIEKPTRKIDLED